MRAFSIDGPGIERRLTRRVDAFLAPRGAEYAAVLRGAASVPNAPRVLAIEPAGGAGSLLLPPGARAAVLFGLCGALAPGTRVGEVVVVDACADRFGNVRRCDPTLTATIAVALADGASRVTALTADAVVWQAREKRNLFRATSLPVVELEGLPLLRAIAGTGVAVGMLRVVSDDAARDIPNLTAAFDAHGRLRPSAVAAAFARRPLAAARLARGAVVGLRVLESTARRVALAFRGDAQTVASESGS